MTRDRDQLKEEFEKEFNLKTRHLDATAFVSPIQWQPTDPEPTSGTFVKEIPLGKDIDAGDISISVKGRVMTVEVKRTSGISEGFKEFGKMFTLPQNVNLKELTSVFTAEGNLKIQAPYQEPSNPSTFSQNL